MINTKQEIIKIRQSVKKVVGEYPYPVYTGIVKVYNNNRFMFSESCRAHRLNYEDALIDTQNLKNDICLMNGLPI